MRKDEEKPNSLIKKNKPYPESRIKIDKEFRKLLEEKKFDSITTAEIAKNAGVNEALIFRYFKSKRGLLYHVLTEFFQEFLVKIVADLKGIKGASNKIRKLIWSHINQHDNNRVFAKILLLEVRNFPEYFETEHYELTKIYNKLVLDIIIEGVEEGQIREDLSASRIRNILLGGIENLCLPGILRGSEINTDLLADELYDVIFNGGLK